MNSSVTTDIASIPVKQLRASRFNVRKTGGIARRHKLLFLLDEFPALGRLDFFETAMAFMGGYGLRAFLIAQSLNQIDKAYGERNSIVDNCHIRVVFANNDERTARRISDALGTATETRAQRNYAGHRLAPWLGHLMVSRQESARALLTPGEIMQLPPSDEIVMVAGHPPIRATKIVYYTDDNFVPRVQPPPVVTDAQTYHDAPPTRPDDWTALPIPARISANTACGVTPAAGGREPQASIPDALDQISTTDSNDLGLVDLESDMEGTDRTASQLQRSARLAALDPDDGIAL
jgi:type IV secretion system protein VirD4